MSSRPRVAYPDNGSTDKNPCVKPSGGLTQPTLPVTTPTLQHRARSRGARSWVT
jgi:hypothetical protein